MLGRGLESLIPKQTKAEETNSLAVSSGGRSDPANVSDRPKNLESKVTFAKATAGRHDSIFYIELEKIKPNPYQPRKDFDEAELASLADSMKQYGMIQPMIVSKVEVAVPLGTKVEYQLIAGERRLRAAELAGLRQVPVIIKNPSEATKLEIALIENVQRQNLNPIEEALAYQRLMREFKMTQAEAASKVGKSREVVANRVRLLDLPYEVQKNISEGKITEGHAKILLMVKNPERQRFLAVAAAAKDMSVRDLEELVKNEESYKVRSTRPIDMELENYKKTIQDVLGAPVAISGSREKGKLAISFYSEEDLERLIKRLTG